MTPEVVQEDTRRQAVRLRLNELGRWWQSLSDTHRAALKAGRLSMMEEAFEAGAIAGLAAIEGAVEEERERCAKVARDAAEQAANIALEGGDRARANESMEAMATRIAERIEQL